MKASFITPLKSATKQTTTTEIRWTFDLQQLERLIAEGLMAHIPGQGLLFDHEFAVEFHVDRGEEVTGATVTATKTVSNEK